MDLVVVLSRSLKSKCSSNLQELVLEFVFVDVQSPDAVPSEDMPERIKEVLQFLNEVNNVLIFHFMILKYFQNS